jgi:rhamnogalacturonyl hydrolase YesR
MDEEINKMLYLTNKVLEQSIHIKHDLSPKSIAKEVVKIFLKRSTNRKYESFFWPTASLSFALELGYTKTQDKKYLDTLKQYYENWIKKGSKINYLDQIMNGYSLIFLYNNNRDNRLKSSIITMYEYVKNYPRKSNVSLPYRKNNQDIILVDYLGMVCPFLSRFGRTFNCEESINLSELLLNDYLLNGMDSKTGLPYHGFRCDTHEKLGIIGWGRGVGWLLIGMIETLACLDKTSGAFNSLHNDFISLLKSVIKFQDNEGYFKWVLNAKEGHIDTSATAMIGYSIKRAIDLNLLDIDYLLYAEKSLSALLKSTKNGQISDSSAECKGIGMYPQHYEWNLWGQGFGTAFALLMTR